MDETEKKVVEQSTSMSKDKSKSMLYGGILLLVILVVVFFISTKKDLRPITMDEISTHNSQSSCWTTINGKVFDVTKFISNHKGGEKILAVCGIDGTDLFTGKSPMGRVHSKLAVKLLSKMQIGTLQE